MRVVYRQEDVIHKYVRKIVTLLFLPAQHTHDVRQDRIPSAANWGSANWLTTCATRGSNTHCWLVYNITFRFCHNRLRNYYENDRLIIYYVLHVNADKS